MREREGEGDEEEKGGKRKAKETRLSTVLVN